MKNMFQTLQLTSRVEVDQLTRCLFNRQSQTGSPMFSTEVWSNTLFSKVKLTLGNVCAQMFCATSWFEELFTINTKGYYGESIYAFINEWGIHKLLWADGEKGGYNGERGRARKHFIFFQNTTKPHSPCKNK